MGASWRSPPSRAVRHARGRTCVRNGCAHTAASSPDPRVFLPPRPRPHRVAMMRHSLARLARMEADEIAWRTAAAARRALDRARFRLMPSRWSRTDLVRVLASTPELAAARAALSARRWDDAQRRLSRHLAASPRRFVIAPADKAHLVRRIAAEFPGSARHAVTRADRIRAGEYDLLGYRGLRF